MAVQTLGVSPESTRARQWALASLKCEPFHKTAISSGQASRAGPGVQTVRSSMRISCNPIDVRKSSGEHSPFDSDCRHHGSSGVRRVTARDADFADAAFEAQIEALRQHFLQGMPERRSALADAWDGCVDDGDEQAWLRLRDVAHKLSGSAPCYGLETVGEAARDLDKLLSGRSPCRRRAQVQVAVARLQALLDAVPGV